MRDLVETVIGGILQREQMQQQAKQHQARQSSSAHTQAGTPHAVKAFTPHASLHAVGAQTSVSKQEHDPELWKVSKQFEAIFVQQMLSEMRKTVSKSGFMPSGFAEDVHASMMDDAVAQTGVKQSSFGIAENIYRQLERNQADMKQAHTAQEISPAADTLHTAEQLATDINLEVNRHAH